jgi:hypothetical protein
MVSVPGKVLPVISWTLPAMAWDSVSLLSQGVPFVALPWTSKSPSHCICRLPYAEARRLRSGVSFAPAVDQGEWQASQTVLLRSSVVRCQTQDSI